MQGKASGGGRLLFGGAHARVASTEAATAVPARVCELATLASVAGRRATGAAKRRERQAAGGVPAGSGVERQQRADEVALIPLHAALAQAAGADGAVVRLHVVLVRHLAGGKDGVGEQAG